MLLQKVTNGLQWFFDAPCIVKKLLKIYIRNSLTMFHFRPLSMSENLAKLAQKIDFSKTESDDLNTDITEIEKPEDELKDTSGQWPWDSIKTKLR